MAEASQTILVRFGAITPPVNNTEPKQGEEADQHDDPKKLIVTSPPFPETLTIPKPIAYPDFDIVGELKKLCIKIPLLQAIQDIPIYAKTIKELCVSKPVRRVKTSPTIHVVRTLSDLLLGEETPIKYEDPRNPIVTIQIYGHSFPNILVDLGTVINILNIETCRALGITALEPTTTLLELVGRSVMLKAILDNEAMEDLLKDTDDQHIQMTVVHNNKPVEIKPGKVININDNLDSEQQQNLIQVLQKNKGSFAWDYPDMKGID
eukprot:PITA_05381